VQQKLITVISYFLSNYPSTSNKLPCVLFKATLFQLLSGNQQKLTEVHLVTNAYAKQQIKPNLVENNDSVQGPKNDVKA